MDYSCILFLTEHGYSKLDATADAESEWTRNVLEGADATLLTDAKSWFMGSNIPNKKRVFKLYKWYPGFSVRMQ